jgi:uncharacterized protein
LGHWPRLRSPSISWMFRRAEFCPAVAEEAVAARVGALWLQLGIVSPEARAIAESAGLDYVEDECTAIVHRAMRQAKHDIATG